MSCKCFACFLSDTELRTTILPQPQIEAAIPSFQILLGIFPLLLYSTLMASEAIMFLLILGYQFFKKLHTIREYSRPESKLKGLQGSRLRNIYLRARMWSYLFSFSVAGLVCLGLHTSNLKLISTRNLQGLDIV